ncbi:MAG: hypothetical protein GY714_02310, partial [Desulfobacterales bacterium]|nr:hypothetical protein [Desulfobacterales bacterium]
MATTPRKQQNPIMQYNIKNHAKQINNENHTMATQQKNKAKQQNHTKQQNNKAKQQNHATQQKNKAKQQKK